jgi:hypothetical protein
MRNAYKILFGKSGDYVVLGKLVISGKIILKD